MLRSGAERVPRVSPRILFLMGNFCPSRQPPPQGAYIRHTLQPIQPERRGQNREIVARAPQEAFEPVNREAEQELIELENSESDEDEWQLLPPVVRGLPPQVERPPRVSPRQRHASYLTSGPCRPISECRPAARWQHNWQHMREGAPRLWRNFRKWRRAVGKAMVLAGLRARHSQMGA